MRVWLALLSVVVLALGSASPGSAQQLQLPRACDLITVAEAQAALGEPIGNTEADVDPALNQAINRSDCTYFASGPNQLDVMVVWSPSPERAHLAWPPDVNPAFAHQTPGVGDDAYFGTGPAGSGYADARVLKGNLILSFQIQAAAGRDADAALADIVNTVLGRL